MSENTDEENKNTKNIDLEERYIESENSNYISMEGRDLIKNRKHPFNLNCSVCNSQITINKYICVICPKCILCPKCEEIHIHPVLKCKSSQLSTLKDVYIYINKRNMVVQSFLKNVGHVIFTLAAKRFIDIFVNQLVDVVCVPFPGAFAVGP